MIAAFDSLVSELGIDKGDPLAVDINALCPRRFTERDLEEFVAAARAVSCVGPTTQSAAFDAVAEEFAPPCIDG